MKSLHADTIIGFLGAGQLARMSALQAYRFGFGVASFSNREELESLEQVTPLHTKGSFDSADDMTSFAEQCDIITLENEFIGSGYLGQIVSRSGTPIYPTPETFTKIENKLVEKQTFEAAGLPVAPYALITNKDQLKAFGEKHGWPFVLKSSKGGYDGYGNEMANDYADAQQKFNKLGGSKGNDIVAEAKIDFVKELAVQVARNNTGSVVYPCCETVQEHHICTAVLAPAPVEPAIHEKAQEMALAATEAIDGTGIFAFEFFLRYDGSLILNESAPRPHNSGHYTIEGCVTSQFENHIRAICGLPLGSTSIQKPAIAMINLLGTHNRPASVEAVTDALDTVDGNLHIYGKKNSRLGRKMGHYTLLGTDIDAVHKKAKKVTNDITI